ncbi:hypothetical protein ACQKE4_14910, partial [Halomonas sp. NPDC076908]|uniref:hypothetical protein n=1 Tax=Halomonas sp. NPDC076908 TaxID=3390567 RepID=UPI003D018A9A
YAHWKWPPTMVWSLIIALVPIAICRRELQLAKIKAPSQPNLRGACGTLRPLEVASYNGVEPDYCAVPIAICWKKL